MVKRIIGASLLASAFLFVGCTGGGPDMSNSSVRQGIISVKIYDNLKGYRYTKKGNTEARYCQNDGVQSSFSMIGNTTRESAILEMKHNAYTMGGNGITNIMCQNDGSHFDTNCNSSINCYGDVVRVSK